MSKQSNLVNSSQDITVDGSGNVSLGALSELRLQTGSVTMDCTPTAGATDSFVWNTSLSVPYVWKQAGTERMKIDSAGRVTMPYQPSFSASGSGILSFSAGSTITQIVPLTYVPHNVGGHFNASSYRFTAPVAGNYFFSAKATQTGTATGPSLFLTKNGGVFGFEMAIGYYTSYHSFGGEIIIPLAVNDYVDMRISNNNSVAMDIDKNRSSLSGFLIG